MASQTWDITLVGYSTGAGETLSQSGDAGVAVRQTWDIQLWDGVNWGAGAGNTVSVGVGAASVELLTWYLISGTVGHGGFGNTLSESWGNATPVAPPSASGAGNTISSAVGNVGRYGGYLMGMTDGFFADFDTSGDLLLPDTTGEFTITFPLPA